MAEKKKGLAAKTIDFSPVKDKTVGEVFGTKPVPMTQLMKKVWDLIKSNNLQKK